MARRVNTALFVIDGDGEVLSALEFQRFLKNGLKLHCQDVEGIQREFGSQRVYVKFKTQEVCDRIVAASDGKHHHVTEEGVAHAITVSHTGFGYKDVKVFNVPFELSNAAVSRALEQYGRVHRVINASYGRDYPFPVDSGIRILKMELRKNIPSFVNIGVSGVRATVVYEGQVRTCAVCNEPGHLRFDCPRRRVAADRLDAQQQQQRQHVDVSQALSDKRTWAEITSSDNTSPPRHGPGAVSSRFEAPPPPSSPGQQASHSRAVSPARRERESNGRPASPGRASPRPASPERMDTEPAAQRARLDRESNGCLTSLGRAPPRAPSPRRADTAAQQASSVPQPPGSAAQQVGSQCSSDALQVAGPPGAEEEESYLPAPASSVMSAVPSESPPVVSRPQVSPDREVEHQDFLSSNMFDLLQHDSQQLLSSDEEERDAEMQESFSSDVTSDGPNVRPAISNSRSRRKRLQPKPNLHRKRSRRNTSMSQ